MVSRFNSIRIDGLFGNNEPTIIQFDNQEDPVKILYGVNGSGKTTIMKIIQHSYCWNPIELFRLPFESITYSLNKRGIYQEESLIRNKKLSCKTCGNSSFFSRSWRDPNPRLKRVEPGQTNESKSNTTKVLCSNCDEVVDLGFEISGNVDDLIRELVDDIDKLLDDYNETVSEIENLALHEPEQLDKKKNNLERKEGQSHQRELKMHARHVLHEVNTILSRLPTLLGLKYLHLDIDDEDYNDIYRAHWDDGFFLKEYNGEMKLIMDREFDFNTKLTITRKTDVPEEIYFGFDDDWVKVDVGNYIEIQEEKEPILHFENSLANDLIRVLNDITQVESGSLSTDLLDWGFHGLFDRLTKKLSIRMPDVHDYWDSDWDKIEQKSTGYRIERFGENPTQRLSVDDWIEVYSSLTNHKIRVSDFLTYHLDADLVAHSKKGTRRRKESEFASKEFSPSMKTPDLIADLFDYEKFMISPGFWTDENRTREQYYVQMPKILNISTERRNDDEYFNLFSTYYKRIINTCSNLVSSITNRINKGSRLEPSYSEETGGTVQHNSDLISQLRTFHNISLEQFVNTILEEIPGASTNHEIKVENLLRFIKQEISDNSNDQIKSGELADVIESVVKFCEVIKLKRYLAETFSDLSFDLENSRIYADKERKHLLKFSDLSSGIRQKFRIFTSVAMQVITAQKSLILIDEPEISLHLSWQRSFVDELTDFLENVTSESRIKVDENDTLENIISIIICTHSPAVLGNHYHRSQKIGESDFSA